MGGCIAFLFRLWQILNSIWGDYGRPTQFTCHVSIPWQRTRSWGEDDYEENQTTRKHHHPDCSASILEGHHPWGHRHWPLMYPCQGSRGHLRHLRLWAHPDGNTPRETEWNIFYFCVTLYSVLHILHYQVHVPTTIPQIKDDHLGKINCSRVLFLKPESSRYSCSGKCNFSGVPVVCFLFKEWYRNITFYFCLSDMICQTNRITESDIERIC